MASAQENLPTIVGRLPQHSSRPNHPDERTQHRAEQRAGRPKDETAEALPGSSNPENQEKGIGTHAVELPGLESLCGTLKLPRNCYLLVSNARTTVRDGT